MVKRFRNSQFALTFSFYSFIYLSFSLCLSIPRTSSLRIDKWTVRSSKKIQKQDSLMDQADDTDNVDTVEMCRCLNTTRCNKQQPRSTHERAKARKAENSKHWCLSAPWFQSKRIRMIRSPRGRTAKIPHARGWLIDIT